MLVTKRGKPLVRIVPVCADEQAQAPASLPDASATWDILGRGLLELTNEEWDRIFEEKWARFEQRPAE